MYSGGVSGSASLPPGPAPFELRLRGPARVHLRRGGFVEVTEQALALFLLLVVLLFPVFEWLAFVVVFACLLMGGLMTVDTLMREGKKS